MTGGPLIIATGLVLMGRIGPGDSYATSVLPAVLVVGCGLALTVAPLTAAVLAAIEVQRAGVGSAINNAVARIGSLLAVAVLPAAAGITTVAGDLGPQFATAMHITAALATAGAAVAFLTIRNPLRSGQRIAHWKRTPLTRTVFGTAEPAGLGRLDRCVRLARRTAPTLDALPSDSE
jgi:hypothetical protein